jgi:transcriptional regulator with XRE-family HTH domain
MQPTIANSYSTRNSVLLVGESIAKSYGSGMDIKQIRCGNLKLLLQTFKTQAEFAQAAGMVDRHVSQIVNGFRDMGDKVARRIEAKLNLPHGWMDTRQTAPQGQMPTSQYDLVTDAEVGVASEKFRALLPAFREYILLKMDELLRYADAIPEFAKTKLPGPSKEGYYDWERELEADMARLKMRDGNILESSPAPGAENSAEDSPRHVAKHRRDGRVTPGRGAGHGKTARG